MKRDSSYRDLGELPSRFKYYDFKRVLSRPFTIDDMLTLSVGINLKSIGYLARLIEVTTDVDPLDLIDQDFIYMLGWHRVYSFPKAPTTVKWTCNNSYYVDHTGKELDSRLMQNLSESYKKRRGIKLEHCGSGRIYIAHQAKVKTTLIDKNFELPEGIAFPTIRTLVELDESPDYDNLGELAHLLRWIKGGETIADKYDIVKSAGGAELLSKARLLKSKFHFGLRETAPIECLNCGHKSVVDREVEAFNVLPNNTEKSILTMLDNVMQSNNTLVPYNTSSKAFLFLHSSLVKRHKEAEQKALIRKNKGNRR